MSVESAAALPPASLAPNVTSSPPEEIVLRRSTRSAKVPMKLDLWQYLVNLFCNPDYSVYCSVFNCWHPISMNYVIGSDINVDFYPGMEECNDCTKDSTFERWDNVCHCFIQLFLLMASGHACWRCAFDHMVLVSLVICLLLLKTMLNS